MKTDCLLETKQCTKKERHSESGRRKEEMRLKEKNKSLWKFLHRRTFCETPETSFCSFSLKAKTRQNWTAVFTKLFLTEVHVHVWGKSTKAAPVTSKQVRSSPQIYRVLPKFNWQSHVSTSKRTGCFQTYWIMAHMHMKKHLISNDSRTCLKK